MKVLILKVNQIFEKLQSLSSESSDILFNESEFPEPNKDKVREFFQSLRVETVSYDQYKFENIYGFQNIIKPIKDKAYNVTKEIKSRFDELDSKVAQQWDYFLQTYKSTQQQLRLPQAFGTLNEEVIKNFNGVQIKFYEKS